MAAHRKAFGESCAGFIFAAGVLMILAPLAARAQNVTDVPVITTVAGTGTEGYNGDNIAATSAELSQPLREAVPLP